MRRSALVLVLLLTASSAGCVQNMDHLKTLLGQGPEALPPEAQAQSNVTSVLVGIPVRFTAEGSRDPQGLGLGYEWRFGDEATAAGPEVVHAFAGAGEVRVSLTVRNAANLTDTANLTMQVLPRNAPPVVSLAVAGAGEGAFMTGATVTLTATVTDEAGVEGAAFDWDFGDGATSHEKGVVRHAFARPGLHAVKVKVTDPEGLVGEASRLVPVGHEERFRGEFDLTTERLTHAFPVVEGARELVVTLQFPGGLGSNDLRLVVKDAAGEETGAVEDATPPGAQDQQTRSLALTADELRAAAPGEWTLEVVRAKGVNVAYTLVARETL